MTIARFVPESDDLVFVSTASDQGRSGVFDLKTQKCTYSVRCHTEAITDISFHPINKLALLGSLDGTWSFHDLHSGKVLG